MHRSNAHLACFSKLVARPITNVFALSAFGCFASAETASAHSTEICNTGDVRLEVAMAFTNRLPLAGYDVFAWHSALPNSCREIPVDRWHSLMFWAVAITDDQGRLYPIMFDDLHERGLEKVISKICLETKDRRAHDAVLENLRYLDVVGCSGDQTGWPVSLAMDIGASDSRISLEASEAHAEDLIATLREEEERKAEEAARREAEERRQQQERDHRQRERERLEAAREVFDKEKARLRDLAIEGRAPEQEVRNLLQSEVACGPVDLELATEPPTEAEVRQAGPALVLESFQCALQAEQLDQIQAKMPDGLASPEERRRNWDSPMQEVNLCMPLEGYMMMRRLADHVEAYREPAAAFCQAESGSGCDAGLSLIDACIADGRGSPAFFGSMLGIAANE